MSHRQLFDSLSKVVRFSEAWLVSTLPRGGLQIVQPSHLGERWVKPYATEFHVYDASAWQAIIEDRAVRGDEAWPEGVEKSRFSVRSQLARPLTRLTNFLLRRLRGLLRQVAAIDYQFRSGHEAGRVARQ